MKKLDKFVLKSFVGPLVLTFFIVQIILILQFLWMYIDELAGKGLEFKVLSELLFEFALTFVPMALPLAILLASLMTFGNMGEFSELTALKSSGIPLQRIMRPVIILVAIISLISFVFSNNVQPYANKQARMLLFDIRRKRPEMNIQSGLFNSDIEGFSIRVGSKDPATNRLDKLIIYDHRDKRGNVSVTVADSGYMQVTPDETGLKMTLFNGYSYNEMAEKNPGQGLRRYPFRKDSFKQQTIIVSLTGFDLERTKMDLFKSSSVSKNVTELLHFADSIRRNNVIISKSYFKEFNESRLYTERNYLNPKNIKPDSTKPVNNLYFDAAKIYDTISIENKKETLIRAIAKAREGANYVNQKKDYLHTEVKNLRQFEVELNKKLTFAFACIVFFLIGAPLGAIIRKGGLGTPAVISILFFVVYYVISISAEKMVKEDLINTYIGMWASSYILLPIGVFLTYKATTDSSILNVETYMYFFRRIFAFFSIAGKRKRMRILLLCNKSPWPPRDGSAFATLNLIRCLSESDVHTTVMALNPDKHHVDQENIPDEIKRLADFILIDTNTDIKLFRIAFNLLFSKKPYNITRFWSVDYRNELLKLRMNDFDLIQIEGLAMHQYLQIIKRITNVPVIFRPHNVENLIWQGLSEEEGSIFRRIYFRILASRLRETEKVIANDFDGVIPFSSTDLTWFNEKGLMKPSLILTPCFSEFDIHTSDNIQNKSICYIGALDWLPNIKGLSWFIESVWPLVLKGEPEAMFHIAGRNASRKTIRKIQGRNIFYEGEVANSEQFLRNKAIMVVPLFSGSGVRIKILEGMLMGKCIVATTVAARGIDYLNGENIFISDNASSFAERIVKLLNDDNLRISTGNNAIGYVRKNYNILATSQRLIKFYQKLLA